jgi:O-antigen/teichoic acid export membrane protein
VPEQDVAATSRQIRGSSVLLLGRVLSMVLNLGTQVLILRYLPKEEYGAFAYGLSFLVTARIISTLGHARTVTRFLSIYDERRDYGRLMGTLVMESGIALGMGALFTIGLALFRGDLTGTLIDDPDAVSVLTILILMAPIEAIDDLLEGTCAVFASPRAIFFRKHVLAPLLRLAVVVALVVAGAGVTFLAAGYVLAALLGVLVYGVTAYHLLRSRGAFSGLKWKDLRFPFLEITRFSIPLLSTELVYIAMGTVSVVILGAKADDGAIAVASFRAVLPLAQVNQFVRRSFTLLFLPQVSRLFERGDREGMRDAYWQTAAWLAVLTFPVFLLTVPLAQPVTDTLFGEKYSSSAPILALLSSALYVNAALGFNAEMLLVNARLRYLLAVNVVCAGLDIGLCWVLVPDHGAMGVAVANATTIVAQNLLNQLGLRGLGIGVVDRRYAGAYATVAIGGVAVWLVQEALAPPLAITLVVAGVVSLLVLRANRHRLDVEHTFPEILSVPIVGRLLGGDPSSRSTVASGQVPEEAGPGAR